MKKINFKSLAITNFLSIGKEIKIPFNNGIHVITGFNLDRSDQNGVGKSAIIDAFFYALFGETLKDLKKEQIVNDIAKKGSKVVLEFDVDKNGSTIPYRIERGIGPSFCKVFINNTEDTTLSTIPVTNNYILNLINSTSTVFRNTITMGINNTAPFMSQKKNEKRDFIEGILRLELFKIMNKIAKDNADTIFRDYDYTIKNHEENNRNIQIYKERRDYYEKNRIDKIDSLIKRIEEYQTQNNKLKGEIITVDVNAFDNIVANLNTVNIKFTDVEKTYNLFNNKCISLATQQNLNISKINEISGKSNTLKQQYDKYPKYEGSVKSTDECKKLIENLKLEIDTLKGKNIEIDRDVRDCNNKIKNIKEVGSFCDKCKRPYPENDVKKNEADIKETESTIENKVKEKAENTTKISHNQEMILKAEIIQKIMELTNEKKILLTQNETLGVEIDRQQRYMAENITELNQLREDQKRLQQQKEIIQSNINHNTNTMNLIQNNDGTMTYCYADINKLKTEKNEFTDLITTSETTKLTLETKIEDYKEKVAIYDVIKFAVSDEGVKSYIIKKLLGILNERINYYLVKMDTNCKLIFNEYFEDRIINDKKNECSYDNFSGGERKRIDLACLFAFMDLRRIQGDVTFNMAFYDELLDSALSANGSEKVFDILKERMDTYNEASFIVTHKKENLKNPLITDIIYLEKSGGITRLAEYKK